MPDAAAAIVADDREAIEAVVLHDLDHVERHRALRVVGVVLAVGRLAAVAVAAQVRHDDGVILRELRRDDVPRHVRLRRAVDEQQRRTVAAAHDVDRRARGLHLLVLEAGREEVQRVGVRLRAQLGVAGSRGSRGDRGQGRRALQQFTAIEICGMGHGSGILLDEGPILAQEPARVRRRNGRSARPSGTGG